MNNLFIDIHVLQVVPPSNINRDDTGSPKSAIYGGVRRARVSSQAWKHAMRKDFAEVFNQDEIGVRTALLIDTIAKLIVAENPELADRAVKLAKDALEVVGIKESTKKSRKSADPDKEGRPTTEYLVFASRPQTRALAKLIAENPDSKLKRKDVIEVFNTDIAVDTALFGRMIANSPDLTYDACAQVAHAISVHEVKNEFDYFTAVDDELASDEVGAGMIGTIEFNSSILYRYATVNVKELADSLGSQHATKKALNAFISCFIKSMPTGKRNTFANNTLPDFVLVNCRDDQPVSLVSAFETPIPVNDEDRLATATERLLDYAAKIEDNYGKHVVRSAAMAIPSRIAKIATQKGITTEDLSTLLDSITNRTPEPNGDS